MAYSDFSFNEINVRTSKEFDLTNEHNDYSNYIHIHVILDKWVKGSSLDSNIFFNIQSTSTNKLAHLLSIPNGYAQLLTPKSYKSESHIPYPPDFYINIIDAVIKDEDLTNMKGFLKHYAYKKGADAATGATDNELEFKDMTLATAKTNTDMIYVKKEFRKLRRKWESDIVESLRVGYTKYKLMRYSSLKKSKPEKDEESNEIGGMIRTREFQNFGQTLLTPDEIWADFVKLMTDQSLYNNFEQNIKIKHSGTTYGPITKYTSFSEFKNDEDKPYFYKIFIGDDTEDDTEDNTINSIHFYSEKNFLGHRFKLLNVRYLWKYGRRASENNSAGVGNSWKNQLDEWRKMMGYPSGHGVNDIRMNQVGNIMLEFLKYNKDLIRDDDCVQEELISNYQKAVANSYWNKYDEVDNEFRKKGIHHSPIFWMIVVIVVYRVFNVFFSLIKKDDTGTSGFVYKLEGVPGFLSGLKDIFKYGDEGQITIHSPYSVLSPYWTLFRNTERMKWLFIKGYTEKNKIWESDPKDGPYIPHSNKEEIHNSGQPDQSIYLPYDSVPDRLKNITEFKLINYTSCVTIGFWFSFLENSVFEKIRKKIFKDVGNSSKKLRIGSKIFIAPVVSILAPILSLGVTLLSGGILTAIGLLWFFIILIVGWGIVKLCMVVYDGIKKSSARLNKIGLFAFIILFGGGLTLLILNLKGILVFSNLEDKISENMQKVFWYIISIVILLGSLILLGIIPSESKKIKWIETLLSSPILEDYLIKNTQDKGITKKVSYTILGGLAMGGGLIFALIKMVPLTLYLFLWGSGPMKGGPGSDNVSHLIDNVGILTMLIVFGLLVWITVRVYNKSIEGKIKVRENAIISAMPHMGYKIPRFKYDALFIGYKSKMSQEDYEKKISNEIEYIEEDGEFEMNDGTRRKWKFLEDIYNNKGTNKSEWNIYSNDYYYHKAKLDELKNKQNVKIGCLDENNFEKNYPPLGVLGMTMFVFAAQMAMTQINSELPKELPEGLKNMKDEGLDKLIKKAKMAAKVKARIILMTLITICVVFIWVIEYLPQLLMVMENMDSREEKALKRIREWNNDNKDKVCPVNLDEFENKCDNELVEQVKDILNKDKLVVPKVKGDVIGVIIGVVVVLLGLLFVYLKKN